MEDIFESVRNQVDGSPLCQDNFPQDADDFKLKFNELLQLKNGLQDENPERRPDCKTIIDKFNKLSIDLDYEKCFAGNDKYLSWFVANDVIRDNLINIDEQPNEDSFARVLSKDY